MLIWHTCKYTLRLHPTARLTIGHKIKNRLERRKKKSQFPPLIWYQTSFDTQKQMLGSCCPFYNSTTIFGCIFLWFWLAQLIERSERSWRKKNHYFFHFCHFQKKSFWVFLFSEMLIWVKWTSLNHQNSNIITLFFLNSNKSKIMVISYQMRKLPIQQGWHNHNFAFLGIFPILTIGHKMLLRKLGFFSPRFLYCYWRNRCCLLLEFQVNNYIKHTTIV